MAKTREAVTFRLIIAPCCGTILYYVNPRLPNYCSECGTRLLGKVKEAVMFTDDNAWIEYTIPKESKNEPRIPAAS